MSRKKGNRSADDQRKSKKAAVLGPANSGRKPVMIAVACTLVMVAIGVYVAAGPGGSDSTRSTLPLPTVQGDHVVFAKTLFDDGRARHFELADGPMTIRYFVLKSSDGVIRAAFDACDVCWPSGKGYTQSGDVMICRNCGRQFESTRVNEVQGGCNPAPLKRRLLGDQLVINVTDIKMGRQYFDFSGRA